MESTTPGNKGLVSRQRMVALALCSTVILVVLVTFTALSLDSTLTLLMRIMLYILGLLAMLTCAAAGYLFCRSFQAGSPTPEQEPSLQTALEWEHQRFRQFFDAMNSGVAIYRVEQDGDDFVFVDLNPAGCRLSAINREDIIGRSVLDVFPGVRHSPIFTAFQQAWRTGEPQTCPLHKYADDRITEWVENYVFRMPDGNIAAIYDDVTARQQALADLRASEMRFRTLFERAPLGVCLMDLEGHPALTNPMLNQLLGYSQQQLRKMSFIDFTHPQDLPREACLFAELTNEQRDFYQMEKRVLDREGHIHWVRLAVSLVRDENNQPLTVIQMMDDISELRQAEQDIAEAERERTRMEHRFQAFFDNSAIGLLIFNTEKPPRYLAVNSHLGQMNNYPARDHVGKTISQILNPDVAAEHEKILQDLLISGKPQHIESSMIAADDSRAYYAAYYFPIPDTEGKTEAIGGVIINQTEQRQTLQALRESEERTRLAVRDAQIGFWDWNFQSHKAFFSPELITLLGYENDDIEQHERTWSRLLHPDDFSIVMQKIKEHCKGQTALYEADVRMKTADHQWKWIHTSGRLMARDKQGKPLRMIGVHRDITAQKKEEAVLRAAREDLERRVNERTHELNAMVQAMAGREIRMMELKDQIQALYQQLTQAGLTPCVEEDAPPRQVDHDET